MRQELPQMKIWTSGFKGCSVGIRRFAADAAAGTRNSGIRPQISV